MPRLMPRLAPARHQFNTDPAGEMAAYHHRLMMRNSSSGGAVGGSGVVRSPAMMAAQRLSDDARDSLRSRQYRNEYEFMLAEARNMSGSVSLSMRGATQSVIERNTFPHKYQRRPAERETAVTASVTGACCGSDAGGDACAAGDAAETAAEVAAAAAAAAVSDDDDDDEREKCTICLSSFVMDNDVR